MNLCVRVFFCDHEADEEDFEAFDSEEDDVVEMKHGYFKHCIELVRSIVRQIKRTSKLQEELLEL